MWKEINVFFARRTAQGALINDGLDTNEGYGFFDVGGGIGSGPSGAPVYGLAVSIVGTSAIQSGVSCGWYANASGGSSPYTYAWRVDGVLQQETSNYLNYTNTGSAFTISVDITDERGAVASNQLQVSIDENSYCT